MGGLPSSCAYRGHITRLNMTARGVSGHCPQRRGEAGGIESSRRSECAGCESGKHPLTTPGGLMAVAEGEECDEVGG